MGRVKLWLVLILVLGDCVTAVAQDYPAQVQEIYVAYYGRPGDPAGIDFWADQLSSNSGNLTAIIDAFGDSAEYAERFGNLSDQDLVNNIYQQLFGRDADPDGLAFYVDRLQSGESTLASIALNVADGIQTGTSDADIVNNKLEVAVNFTAAVDLLGAFYADDQIEQAFVLVASVDGTASSLQTAVDMTLGIVASFGLADGRTVQDYFTESVSDSVVQSICISCHVEGGLSGHTRIVFVPSTDVDYHAYNFEQFSALAEEEDDASEYVLSKIQGVAHGGGVQATAGSAAYDAMAGLMALLTGEAGSSGAGDLFEGLTVSQNSQLLRRATLLIAGKLPQDEIEPNLSDAEIRKELRSLMQGENFHQFLIEGANDRLLTDKWIENLPVEIFSAPYYSNLPNYVAQLSELDDVESLRKLRDGVGFGIARQALESIAYVVENDLPYTEILTADYTLVNPQLAFTFGSNVSFDDDENIDQWKVGTVEDYFRIDSSMVYERLQFGANVSGGLATNYPQAGILNTYGWLSRYPSTDTNRNRARARWTWYHFLGLDVEKSASRTTDPDALADTDNPTMKNPNCTVCHEILDPIAATYQNYGDLGFYKDKAPGLDSLPRLYKSDDSLEDPYQPGDVWYRDMREPGLEALNFTDTDQTMVQLAAAIVNDDRFSQAVVKFWWPSIMGEELIPAPEETEDSNYQSNLNLFLEQSATVAELAEKFRGGFDGGAAYNLKDLLTEMMMSDWFMIDSAASVFDGDDNHLLGIGAGRLLTPEQLDRKTEAVTGVRWFESEVRGRDFSQLTAAYRLLYGGIDSDGVTQRATVVNSLMSTVVEAQPLQLGCVIVAAEFQFPASERKVFTMIDKDQNENNAESAVRAQLQFMHQNLLGETLSVDDLEIDRALALFTETRQARIDGNMPTQLHAPPDETCPFQFIPDTENWDLSDPGHTLNTWVSMMIYFMTDYRYIFE